MSVAAAIYAVGLAIFAAIVMGVLPGLKATGMGLTANLHALTGRSGSRLGATWTTLVVAQVAVAVAVLPAAAYMAWQVVRMEASGPGFAAENIAVGTATLSGDPSAATSNRIVARQRELMARLQAEPGVIGVTFSANTPGFAGSRQIEFEAGVRLRDTGMYQTDIGWTGLTLWPSTTDVGINMFDTYGVDILAGRGFNASDVGTANAVVVNRSFVDMYLQDANAVGLRFRYTPPQRDSVAGAPQYQIVGVVRDFPSFPPNLTRQGEPTIYHPAAVGDFDPAVLSVRFAGEVPSGFVNRFREIGAEVDPALLLHGVSPLVDRYNEVRTPWRSLAWAIGLVTASVLLLSAAGIYALMSFTVVQRTREFGIRTALGAQPRRVLLTVFVRAIRQLALGVVVGSLLSASAFVSIGLAPSRAAALVLAVAIVMLVVGLLATLGPARRGLRIQAVEALRADA